MGMKRPYENGILTIKVNDAIVGQHVIGLSTVVEDAKYDPDQEAIVITFKLLDALNVLAEKTGKAFVDTFLNEYGYLLDYVDGNMMDLSLIHI